MEFEYQGICQDMASRLAFICQTYSEFFEKMIAKSDDQISKHYLDGILQGIRLTLAAENLQLQFNDEYVYLVNVLSGRLILKYDRRYDNGSMDRRSRDHSDCVRGEYHET